MTKQASSRERTPRLTIRLINRFGRQIAQRAWLIAGSFLAMFGEVAFRLLEPWPLKFVFDDVIAADPAAAGETPAGMKPSTLLLVCAVGLVVIVGGRAVCSYLRRVGFALAGDRVLTECRSDLLFHIQRLSVSYHDKNSSGDLLARVTGDVNRLKEVLATAAMPLIAHALTVVAMATIMLIMNWRLSIVALAVLPMFWLSTQRIGRKIHETARRERARHGKMGALAAEAIGSIRTVQAQSLEDVHGRSFEANNRSSYKEGVKGKRLSAKLLGTAEILIAAATAVVLWYGGTLAMKGQITPGELIVFLAYLKTTCRPIRNLAKYTARLAKAAASAERILEVFDAIPEIQDRPGAVPAPAAVHELAFNDVTFGYDPDRAAVSNIDIHAAKGEIVAFVGHSGAGKSTLANLILRLHDPTSGTITLNGTDIRDFKVDTLRRSVSVVPQDSTLFAGTVRDNIACTGSNVSDEQVYAAARLACAHDFIMSMRHGYDTAVAERGATLSVGQCQRIVLARAAMRDGPLLIFDEPTASVDQETATSLRQAIRNLSRDRICFIISHDLATAVEADRIVYLDAGRIVEQGTHTALMARDGAYARMYRLQTGNPVTTVNEEAVDAPAP